MNREMEIIKGLINMLASRVERLEKKIDALEEVKQNASKKEFDESIKYFKKQLTELDNLI